MLPTTSQRDRTLATAVLLTASSLLTACTATIEGGGTSGAPSGSTTSGGTGVACSAFQPLGPAITVFTNAAADGSWSDPKTGLSGTLFLEPATAGSFTGTDASGTHFV